MGPKLQGRPASAIPSQKSSAPSTSTSNSQMKTIPPSSVAGEANTGVLEPEMDALFDSLKKTTVTTGQIFKFYSEASRHKVQHFVPKPPRSLTSALATELARYDQICDTLDSKLARAIATLQRDLNREEARIKEEEERKALEKEAEEKANQRAEIIDVEMQPAELFNFKKPTLTPTGPLGRRQSKISLSALHRSQLPLKLDLSSAALRFSGDEAAGMGLTGLASPISLAPKSARPMAGNELPPDLLAAFAASAAQNQGVDIDLTLPDSSHSIDMSGMEPHGSRRVSGDLGASADKPIELDLDLDGTMTDLFGDVPGGDQNTDVEGLFSAADSHAPNVGASSSNNMGDIFNALSNSDSQRVADDLLASLGAQSKGHNIPNTGSAAAPSPASLLASLTSGTQHDMPQDMSGAGGSADGVPGQGQTFDYNNINMDDISNSFAPYFDTKGDEDMMAMAAQLLRADADSASSQPPDAAKLDQPSTGS